MPNRSVTLNGQTHWPNTIRGGRRKVGEVLDADNGGATYVHMGQKGEWTLEWVSPKESVYNAIVAIALLSSNFSYTHDNGVTYTVFCPPDGLQHSVTHLDSRSANAATFSISLTLREA